MFPISAIWKILPGLLLCTLVTMIAFLLQLVEVRFAGEAYLEALVLAILLGVAIRTAWTPEARWHPGVAFSAKILLEVAVVLLGASVSVATVLALGPALLGGIVLVVAVAIATSYAISRALGLKQRMAILVACGNSICGNSAIAAVAPVIGADGDDVASSIAFTAVLGVIVVLLLPLLVPVLLLSLTQYGVLAGLTVYAVPQVLAATLPIGALSNQVGTVVKLVRVLMLGPVVLALSLLTRRLRDAVEEQAPNVTAGDRPKRAGPRAARAGALVYRGLPDRAGRALLRVDTSRLAAADQDGRKPADHGVHGGVGSWGRYPCCRSGWRSRDRCRHSFAGGAGRYQPCADPAAGRCLMPPRGHRSKCKELT